MAQTRLQDAPLIAEPDDHSFGPVILPSLSTIPLFASHSSLTPVVCDDRAIKVLLEALIERSGLSRAEICRRLGTTTNSLRQYLRGRRSKPSLKWFVRLAEACGARVTVELPTRK